MTTYFWLQVGDARERARGNQLKIYYWNITNPHNVLYHGETPKVKTRISI